MIKEVDYMEFATDGAAQAAYVTSATSYISNGDIDDEDFADISDWTDSDIGTGESSQVTFDGNSCMKLTNGGSAGGANQAFRIKDVGSFSGARTVFTIKAYFDAIGTFANADDFAFSMFDGATHFSVRFCSDGIFIHNGVAPQEVGTDLVVQDTWQEWTFDVNWVAQTVDVYLNGASKATGVSCAFASSTAEGTIWLIQYGGTTTNRITYLDAFLAGSDFGSAGSSLQSYSGSVRSQGAYSLKGVSTTDALNKKLTRTLASHIDLTGVTQLVLDMYASRTGENIKIGIHDSGGTTTELTPYYLPNVADQEQTVLTNNFLLGDSGGIEFRQAQSFIMSGALTVTAVEVRRHAGTAGTPTGNWTLRIETNNVNKPSGTLADANATVTVTPPAESTVVKGVFATPFALSAATTYWLVILCDNQATETYWYISGNNSGGYSSGGYSTSLNGGTTWSAVTANIDLYFKIYANKPNVWQSFAWDLSAVTDANKDDIDSIIVTIANADAANTFYIDNLHARKTRPVLIL